MPATTEVRTFCRLCNALCGVVATVDGDRVTAVRGDRDHPISRGYTCSKGRALPAMLHHADRLEQPLRRGGDGELRPISWEDALDGLAASIAATVARRGPTAVGAYRATHFFFDCNGRAAGDRFLRRLGTHQLYSSITIDTPNKSLVPDLMVGAPFVFPIPDWDGTELLIAVGQNLVVSHGHVSARPDGVSTLRGIRRRGGHVVAIDPRVTETAKLADLHLRPRPGTDAALLAHLVREVLAHRPDQEYLAHCSDDASAQRLRAAVEPFDADATSARTGVPAEQLTALRDLVLTTPRLSCVTGTGVSMGPAANAAEWLSWVLSVVTGSLDRPGGMLVNPGLLRPTEGGPAASTGDTGPAPRSRSGARHRYGELPTAVLPDEILAGEITTLFVLGGNPMTAFPDTGRTREALEALDELVVVDVAPTETTALATIVLPVAHQLERADLPLFLDSSYPVPFTQYGARVVPPGGQRRPMWWVFSSLAKRLGQSLPAVVEAAMARVGSVEAEDELLAVGAGRSRVPWEQVRSAPSVVLDDDAPRPGWLVPDLLPRGGIELCPPELADQLAAWWASSEPDGLVLLSRRLPRQINSSLRDVDSQRRRGPRPTVLMNPADAAQLGLVDGEAVEVSTEHGSTAATLEVSAAMREGAISVPHGWSAPGVNALISTEFLDELTSMPQLTALPVRVSRTG